MLVTGLLLIGVVAAEDGLFEAAGTRIARVRIGGVGLLLALLGLVACVTAVLNLDTAVVFLTPVLVHAARSRALDERPFLYGAVFMANAGSTLLLGSNLTNLLVPAHASPAVWLVGSSVTALLLAVLLRPGRSGTAPADAAPLRVGFGLAATAIAAGLVVALPQPALPVLATGVAAVALRRVRPRLDLRAPALLFLVAVALGTLARSWHGPALLLAGSGRWETAFLAAGSAVAVNNLPAAVLFSTQPPPHPVALLLGLDLGPNLAVTGSLSAVLWLRAARSVGARPSIVTYTLLGLVIVPVTLAASLAVS